MSESDPTGYRESPDTTDGPVEDGGEQVDGEQTGGGSDVTLTTDSDAQHDDSIMRPGNQSD